jgi:hypothetical protein
MYKNSDFPFETLPLKILTHANLTHRSVKFIKTFFIKVKSYVKRREKKRDGERGKRLSPRL